MMWILLSVLLLVTVAATVVANPRSFGKTPRGARLERIQKSPNYRDGKFWNLSPTQQLTSDRSLLGNIFEFAFRAAKGRTPKMNLPSVKTDLKQLDVNEDMLIWMGHSSLFIQTDGKRILVDPALLSASPVSFFNKPFRGAQIYAPDDIPDIDYLIITHDHWDHLDYRTVKRLKPRTGKVICALGVGEHFEYWGFDKDRIVELDWNESAELENGFVVHCLPARHFSGRGFSRNKTLWASFMLQTASKSIYLSGDGGYDTHFAEIAERFGNIDLAVVENGQYSEDWKYIHLLPDDLLKAVKDLHANRLLTVHNSKYALGKHAWKEPLVNISEAAEKNSLNLITPMIGEPVRLNDTTQVFGKWWENID